MSGGGASTRSAECMEMLVAVGFRSGGYKGGSEGGKAEVVEKAEAELEERGERRK